MLTHLYNKTLYLDTNPIIYLFNNTQGFVTITRNLFKMLDDNQATAFAGELCLAELLVKPTKENRTQEVQYIHELFDKQFIQLLPHQKQVFLLAVNIRANTGLKMVDAIHVATAIYNKCDVFVTGDAKIVKSVTGIIDVLDLNAFQD